MLLYSYGANGHDTIDSLLNVDDKWNLWKKLFLDILDKRAPTMTKRVRNKDSVPWMTREIRSKMINRDDFKKQAILTKCNVDWERYKSYRNDVNISMRKAKMECYKNRIGNLNNNPKQAWKTVNDTLGHGRGDVPINEIKIGKDTISSPIKIAECFNDYFVNVGPAITSSTDGCQTNIERYINKVDNTSLFRLLVIQKFSNYLINW